MELDIILIIVIIVFIVIVFAAVITYLCIRRSKRRVSGGLRTDVGLDEPESDYANDAVACLTRYVFGTALNISDSYTPTAFCLYTKRIEPFNSEDEKWYIELRRIYNNFIINIGSAHISSTEVFIELIDAIAFMKYWDNNEIVLVDASRKEFRTSRTFIIRLSNKSLSKNTYVLSLYGASYQMFHHAMEYLYGILRIENCPYFPHVFFSSFKNHDASVYQHIPLWFITEPYEPVTMDVLLKGDGLGKYFVTMYNIATFLRMNNLEFTEWTISNMGIKKSGELVLINFGVAQKKMGLFLHARTKHGLLTINDEMMYAILCEIYAILLSNGDISKYNDNIKTPNEFRNPNIIFKRITQLPLYAKCFDPSANEQFNKMRTMNFSWIALSG